MTVGRSHYSENNVRYMSGPRKFFQRGGGGGGPNLTFFLFKLMRVRGSKYHYKWPIIGQPAKRHLYGVSLAGRMMAMADQ